MAFDDVHVGVKVTYDSSQLRQAISDFKEGKISVQQLQDATKSLNSDIKDQGAAIRAFNAAQRVQHFEMIQNIRLLSQFTTLLGNMNSVIQTGILRQIEQNQVTVAQRESFKDLITESQNLVNALDILGPANSEVQNAFKGLIRDADSLNSGQLVDLIEHLEQLKTGGNLSAEEIGYLNEKIAILRDLLKETEAEESAKKFNDLFTSITQLGLAAGSLGTFILQLERFHSISSKLAAVLSRLRGGGIGGGGAAAAGAAGFALLIPQILAALGILPQGGSKAGEQSSESFTKQFENLQKWLEDNARIPTAYGDTGGTRQININVENMSIRSDADLYEWAKSTMNLINQEESKRSK